LLRATNKFYYNLLNKNEIWEIATQKTSSLKKDNNGDYNCINNYLSNIHKGNYKKTSIEITHFARCAVFKYPFIYDINNSDVLHETNIFTGETSIFGPNNLYFNKGIIIFNDYIIVSNKTIQIINLTTKNTININHKNVSILYLAKSNSTLILLFSDNTIEFWDLNTFSYIQEFNCNFVDQWSKNCSIYLTVSPHSNHMMLELNSGFQLWDIDVNSKKSDVDVNSKKSDVDRLIFEDFNTHTGWWGHTKSSIFVNDKVIYKHRYGHIKIYSLSEHSFIDNFTNLITKYETSDILLWNNIIISRNRHGSIDFINLNSNSHTTFSFNSFDNSFSAIDPSNLNITPNFKHKNKYYHNDINGIFIHENILLIFANTLLLFFDLFSFKLLHICNFSKPIYSPLNCLFLDQKFYFVSPDYITTFDFSIPYQPAWHLLPSSYLSFLKYLPV